MSERKKAAALEAWKQREGERARIQSQQEMGILIDKIRSQWSAEQSKASREWEEKEAQIITGFGKIETAYCKLKAAMAERQTLEQQLKVLTAENDQLKQLPSIDTTRQERLVRINNLRLEIRQLEEELTKTDAEFRSAVESKNRYKRLFLESNKILQSILQEQKQGATSSRRYR
jgi:hypothetical protein